jgi:glycosyltransferase involved in cell wall biosynthesis
VRVLHLTKKYPEVIGGDAVAVEALASHQRADGVETAVATFNCPQVRDDPGVIRVGPPMFPRDLDRLGLRRAMGILSLRTGFQDILSRASPDLIHCHSAELGYFVARAARRAGVPMVNTCHSLTFPRLRWSPRAWAEVHALRHSRYERVTAVYPGGVRSLQAIGIPHAVYIPNGLDADPFRQRTKRSDAQAPDGGVLFVGRLEAEKRVDLLISAISRLRQDGMSVTLHVVGEGGLRTALRALAEKLGLTDSIAFLGSVPRHRMPDVYRKAACLVLPSAGEGFPLVLLEAWASGMPVVATRVGGLAELCQHEEDALLVPPDDVAAISEALRRVLTDRQLAKRLGAAGRARVLAEFTWDRVTRLYAELYHEVLEGSPEG